MHLFNFRCWRWSAKISSRRNFPNLRYIYILCNMSCVCTWKSCNRLVTWIWALRRLPYPLEWRPPPWWWPTLQNYWCPAPSWSLDWSGHANQFIRRHNVLWGMLVLECVRYNEKWCTANCLECRRAAGTGGWTARVAGRWAPPPHPSPPWLLPPFSLPRRWQLWNRTAAPLPWSCDSRLRTWAPKHVEIKQRLTGHDHWLSCTYKNSTRSICNNKNSQLQYILHCTSCTYANCRHAYFTGEFYAEA